MEVISTRRYEARPPADSHASILVDPRNAVATVKEEEWETRKKKEITTTRQIETRVKRQVVLEDGEVVVDSGPLVTTNTTEDVEQQEHTTQERRTTGDEPQKVEWPAGVTQGAVVQKELNETIVKSREEIEELLETEDQQQLGDITDEAYLQAVRNNRGDLRVALAESKRQLAGQQNNSGPRVLQHTTRSNKVVDTEKTLERSELKQDGQIVTERKTTVEHEEIKDDELPEEINGERDEVDEAREIRKEASQRYVKTRDEDIVDYVQNGERVAREMRFVSETTEAERTGDWPNEPPPGLRTGRSHKHGFPTTTVGGTTGGVPTSRKDALTRKPLDLEEEDEARKFETSKWLESHFGSESRSSHGSLDDELEHQANLHHHNTSYINVTMKSSCAPQPSRERLDYRQQRYNKQQQQQQQQQQHQQQQQQSRHQQQQSARPANGRESNSPSGYFHGISEWSERYQSTEKQSSHTRARSPAQYIVERTRETSSSRLNGHHPASATTNTENARNHKETSYTRSYETASSRRHQERHSPPHERPKTDPPSPPLRRKAREQVINTKTERNYQHESVPRPPSVERGASPVHVVQRTWESRSRDVREERRDGRTNGVVRSSEHERRRHSSPERSRPRPRTPDSRSISPSPARSSPVRREKKEEQSRPSKSPSPSKYKIGESFRKLVGKLRSASSERRNKRTGSSSTSQLTQTDDSSTYLQYNSVDRNIPLGPEYDTDDRPPERPPRSPRNAALTTTVNVSVNSQPAGPRESKSSSQSKYHKSHARSASPRHTEFKETTGATASTHQRNEQPIHRYYLGEDPYGGSIYGREKGYRESKMHSRTHRGRTIEEEYSAESNSLGRFSKSTGRLANDYDQTDHERISAQTLPRKMHISNQSRQPQQHQQHQQHQQQQHQQQHQQQQQQQHHTTSTTTTTTTTRRMTNGHNSSPTSRFNNINNINNINNNNINNINNNNNNNYEPSRQYGSMINISFRNTVTSPKTTHFVQTSINTQPPPPPQKPERTYKSTLSRSKSFNVEIADDGIVNTPRTNGYSSNIRSSSQLNKLDETPPLKSPGILASINRSNRDLMMRNGKHEY